MLNMFFCSYGSTHYLTDHSLVSAQCGEIPWKIAVQGMYNIARLARNLSQLSNTIMSSLRTRGI
jgi:hypothetical protein